MKSSVWGDLAVTGVVDAGLGQRLLDGPLRWTSESLPTDSIPSVERRVLFSPSGALVSYFYGTPR